MRINTLFFILLFLLRNVRASLLYIFHRIVMFTLNLAFNYCVTGRSFRRTTLIFFSKRSSRVVFSFFFKYFVPYKTASVYCFYSCYSKILILNTYFENNKNNFLIFINFNVFHRNTRDEHFALNDLRVKTEEGDITEYPLLCKKAHFDMKRMITEPYNN